MQGMGERLGQPQQRRRLATVQRSRISPNLNLRPKAVWLCRAWGAAGAAAAAPAPGHGAVVKGFN